MWCSQKRLFLAFLLFCWLVHYVQCEMCYFFPSLVLAVVFFMFAADVQETNSKACTCVTLTYVYLATSCFYSSAQINLQFIPHPSLFCPQNHPSTPSSPSKGPLWRADYSLPCLVAALAEEWRPNFCQVKVPSIKTVFTFSLWDPVWGIYNLAVQICCRLNLSYIVSSGEVVTGLSDSQPKPACRLCFSPHQEMEMVALLESIFGLFFCFVYRHPWGFRCANAFI